MTTCYEHMRRRRWYSGRANVFDAGGHDFDLAGHTVQSKNGCNGFPLLGSQDCLISITIDSLVSG